MLNHIDDHKEAYDKPQWTNEAIVKTWIKTNESKLKNLFISGVSHRRELLIAYEKKRGETILMSDTDEDIVDEIMEAIDCG